MQKKRPKKVGAQSFPAWTEKPTRVPGELKRGQHLFKFKEKLFLVEKWGYKDRKSHHIGIQALNGLEPVGSFLAVASYHPLNEKLPGLDREKSWSIEAGLVGKALADKDNSVKKRLVRMIQVQAGSRGIEALVAKSVFHQKEVSFWESLGFKRVGETKLFVKMLK